MDDLWNYLKTAEKPIVLYGMGNGADKIISVLEKNSITVSGVFASDGFVRNKTFHGFKIASYNELKSAYKDMIVLLCFGTTLPDVLDNIKRIAKEQELYAPDVPVYGNILFDGNYYEENRNAFDELSKKFADEQSKKVFLNTIKYKLTGDLKYLFDCETEQSEVYGNILKLGQNETFVDLGAYRGDTVEDFLSRVDGYAEIHAVEPDKKTFLKLMKNTEKIERIKLYNTCIGEADGVVPFYMGGSRGSTAAKDGDTVPCRCLDSIFDRTAPTLIKMDIEGNEKGAIIGGKNVISRHKPKMQISCYHRSEDLLELPRAVFDIRDDYKIYMRHFKSVPAWDTCYYFV